MPSIFLYLLKLSIGLGFVWGFYQLFLRRLTFYDWNRWYLLGYSGMCFFIPLIDVGALEGRGESVVVQYIPSLGGGVVSLGAERPAAVDGWDLVLMVMVAGAGFLAIRLVVKWLSLRRVRLGAKVTEREGIRIYEVDRPIAPFSFGRTIYINPRLHTKKEWADIILHEYVHVRQRHSVDVLLVECLCIVNWYNPFVWLVRHSVRQNLEFVADRRVLQSGIDRKGYQYHLLQVVGDPAYRLANNFSFKWTKFDQFFKVWGQKKIIRRFFGPIQSSLKKRIIMMNKIKSGRVHLVRFLFVLPLLGVLLVAFRNRADSSFGRPLKMEEAVVQGGGLAEQNPVLMRTDLGRLQKVHGKAIVAVRVDTSVPTVLIGQLGQRDTAEKDWTKKVLYVVDGEVIGIGFSNSAISPEKIYAMDILKGEQAVRYYGEKGKNGVVVITTKDFWEKHPELASARDSAKVRVQRKGDAMGWPMQLGKMADPTKQPLYVVDDVVLDEGGMASLKPDDIESITVLKDAGAVAIYGEKAKNGVILIKTKKKTSYQPKMTIYGEDGPISVMGRNNIRAKVNGESVLITADNLREQ